MKKNNKISGITLKQDAQKSVYICYVEEFSNELQEKIRELLNGVWHGVSNYQENQNIYNYTNTVKDFLDRYQEQSDNTKKGIIGELLTHILIPSYISDLEVISIMKNKEERSIRKGFDIVYSNNSLKNIWYCEVKSGGDVDGFSVDNKNNEILNKAKKGINTMINDDRTTLWDSVLNDIRLTIFDNDKQMDISKLLKLDHPNIENRNMSRNVILSSVLYKSLDTKISYENLKRYKMNIDNEHIFAGLIVFSIQKPTYKKIENFLIEESNVKNDGKN
ncbi:hypothetical protein BSPWISOX_2503 [uncultured Gammaproteobacteria bacterium]|jgi:hypothetical protein|nr:hypothetical protein BSPWISOX_2503 [uncultured Gammaproteobacteria bacterium]